MPACEKCGYHTRSEFHQCADMLGANQLIIDRLNIEITNLRARIRRLERIPDIIGLHDWTLKGTMEDHHDIDTSVECTNIARRWIAG